MPHNPATTPSTTRRPEILAYHQKSHVRSVVPAPDDALRLFQNLFQVLEAGSPVYIAGQMLDDSRLSPAETVAFNLVFINIFDDGQAYTEQEYRAWLTEAGFTGIERVRLAGGSSLITARKPA